MIYKILIASTDFDSSKSRSQEVKVLVGKNNALPSAALPHLFKNIFGRGLQIGNEFYRNATTDYLYATTPEQIPDDFHFIPVKNLTIDNSDDYLSISKGIKKLGYSV
ncbi:hypothetical protein IJ135_02340 [Candidatus Saccharibacteria bacterium]|nr:hypothetical protein [Candidatus Saccharibacteria bacterium]